MTPTTMTSTRSVADRGQAMVTTVLVTAALFVAVVPAVVGVGGRILDRARAQTAADAAALAGVPGGRGGAATLAERNGATLLSFAHDLANGRVTVVVRVGSATATASASDRP